MNSHNQYNEGLYKQLKGIEIYKKYPQMLPKLGDYYQNKKLLLVCESFYFPTNPVEYKNHKKYQEHCQPDWWYGNDHTSIIKDEQVNALDWIDMHNLPLYYNNGKPRPWATLGKTIIEAQVWHELSNEENDRNKRLMSQEKALSFCSMMNYFTRPADQSDGLKPQKLDIEWSARTFWEVVNILEPDAICIASTNAYNTMLRSIKIPDSHDCSGLYEKYQNRLIGTYHPSPMTWNRAGGKHGRVKFIDFLQMIYKKV